jgi:2-keto-4-pentenoate hydratase/2-oxohepta-3-ene-1,7-dioic acid hydratase in catechol pathway
VETFTGDDVTTTFNLTATVTSVNHMIVSVNGLVQQPTTHYTLVTGDLVFSEAPSNNAVITVQILNTSRA